MHRHLLDIVRATSTVVMVSLSLLLPMRAHGQAIIDPSALTRTEIQLLQDAMIWSGHYQGLKDGGWGRMTNAALASWRRDHNLPDPAFGVRPDEVHTMLRQAIAERRRYGWRAYVDPETGVWIGYPSRLVTSSLSSQDGVRSTTYSGHPHFLMTTLALPPNGPLTPRQLLNTYSAAADTAGVDYRLDRADRQVIAFNNRSGQNIYIRFDLHNGVWRGFSTRYSRSEAETMNPIAMAVSAEFSASGVPPITGNDLPALREIYQTAIASVDRDNRQPIRPTEPAAPTQPYAATRPAPAPVAPASSAGRFAGSGTGFVVDRQGHLLTNQHVIADCDRIALASGETLSVIAADRNRDLALLRSSRTFENALTFRRDQTIDLGERVLLAGYPLYRQVSTSLNFTDGIVTSRVGLQDDPMHFQINAAMQPGNSGGPVMDGNGLVIGIGVSRLNDRRMLNATGMTAQGMNYAIRGQVAEAFLLENRILIDKLPPTAPRTTAQIAAGLERYVLPVLCYTR